ncbi:MAG: type II toxin-antitoxin system prevent-host-death family antitoxin [Planctomycetota bacterium]
MIRSKDITIFREHRQHLRDHLAQVNETGRPLYITTKGQTDGVLLSPKMFDALADKAELIESLAMIDGSMEEMHAGKGQPIKEALQEIADELGLKLDR